MFVEAENGFERGLNSVLIDELQFCQLLKKDHIP